MTRVTVKSVKPLVFGLFIIMLVYVPILYLEGIEGKMFKPMAATVVLALGGSLLVALFLMPAMAYLFVPARPGMGGKPGCFDGFTGRMNRPSSTSWGDLGWWCRSSRLRPSSPCSFFSVWGFNSSQLDEGDLVINLTRDTQQDIDTSARFCQRTEVSMSCWVSRVRLITEIALVQLRGNEILLLIMAKRRAGRAGWLEPRRSGWTTEK